MAEPGMKDGSEKTVESEKVYNVKRRKSIGHLPAMIAAVISSLMAGSLMFGIISFSRPELLVQARENMIGTTALIFGVFSIGVLFISVGLSMGDATFVKASAPEMRVKFKSAFSKALANSVGLATGVQFVPDWIQPREAESTSELEANEYSYAAASNDTHFETYISEVLRSLSAYASSSETTAKRLLDKGVAFMAGGLFFYIIAIIVWQMFANLATPDSHVMYIGMVACSFTFIVIEFLAAWFFKQYRYYVEVSLSCLRVRSVYDRYLLSFYALQSFEKDNEVEARDKMIDTLKEDVKWPSHKGAASNDFNYMMESMGAAHTSLEKIRKIFKDSGKGKP